ncbi:RecA-like recombination protein [Escherichia phage Bp7]|uniref:RecA-like recombination protein n=1 Tax=Escherichia phage Bp7 TaxID=1052121 RepID=G3MUX8_9CAUD|nr:DNA repair protein [Escherichia phage Bp7]AEN93813.1 RecA-like recombination protein [Escherichia phage Bp7]
MSDLKSRLIKASTSKMTADLTKSKLFNGRDEVPTRIPMLNIALGGALNAGLQSGLTIFAAPSKHFKTLFGLTMVAAYMKKYPDAICLFYDSEFGASESYFRSMGVDLERVVHTPIQSVEQLKVDMTNQLEEITRGEKVIIFIDSIGNTASKKETEDALNEKVVGDMTRAKSLKSLFRIVTPYLTIKDIPCVAINHTAMEIGGMYPKEIMGGGTGILYSASTVFFISKRQVKDGTELTGYDFTLKAEKSRTVKEKSTFPITVNFEGGIDPFSGLLEMATDIGFVVKPKAGWYNRAFLDETTGEMVQEEKAWRAKATDCVEFWGPLFKHAPFREAIENKYKLGAINSIKEVDDAVNDLINSRVSKNVAVKLSGNTQSAADIENDLENMNFVSDHD